MRFRLTIFKPCLAILSLLLILSFSSSAAADDGADIFTGHDNDFSGIIIEEAGVAYVVFYYERLGPDGQYWTVEHIIYENGVEFYNYFPGPRPITPDSFPPPAPQLDSDINLDG